MSADLDDPVTFHRGDVLRKWLEAAEMSGQELAAKAEIDKNSVTRALRGQSTTTETLEKIVAALGRTMTDLHRPLGASAPGLRDDQREVLALWEDLWPDRRTLILDLMRGFVGQRPKPP